MKLGRILAGLLVFATAVPVSVHAEHTRYWRQTDFVEFQKGTANGVAIRSDGKLAPAPKFDSFADPNLAYLWALRLDSHARLYAAGGSNAKVVRFDDAGKATSVFESTDLVAQAIAFDAKDNLYVGTSPDGKVYELTPDGKKSVFFDPKTKYIWALAFDSHGALFVATGDMGQVFVVTPDGKGQLFYQSQERHARSLAFDSKGNLLIGTEPDGLILRVDVVRKTPDSPPQAGNPFVLYETNNGEVTSLITDSAGNLYAASIGEKSRAQGLPRINVPVAPQGPAQPSASAAPGQGGVVVTPATPPTQQPAAAYSFPAVSTSRGAEVVKIAPDGSPETLWTSRDDLVFSLGLSPAGRVLLGTGDNGAVIELEGDQVYASVAKAASAQVTGFATAPDGRIFVGTANPGKIFAMGPGYQTNGTFESQTFDARIFSRWGRLTWWGDNGGAGDKVAFYVRSGNTSDADQNWSPWAGPYKDATGSPTDCPPARFVQWKAVFLGTDKGLPPDISWVRIAYQPKNVAPVIDDIVVQDPGIRVAGFPEQQAGPGSSAPAQLRYPRTTGGNQPFPIVTGEMGRGSQVEPPVQGFEQKGYQSALWSAHDDNDDELTYAIYFRGENEQNWRLLKDKLTQKHYSWDTTSMPDGAYYLKIVASDSPSNPADQALSAERTSDRWLVANTPPRIENLTAGSGVLNTRASFDAISSSGAIARAEYSVDAGEWQVVFPADVLSDAPNEHYALQLPGLSPGEHILAVRVFDQARNVTAAKFSFSVQARATPSR